MKKTTKYYLGGILLCMFSFAGIAVSKDMHNNTNVSTSVSDETKLQLIEEYGKLPLSFEANQGQTDEQVKFLSRGSGYNLFLAPTEAVLTLIKPADQKEAAQGIADKNANPTNRKSRIGNLELSVFRMKLVGANKVPTLVGIDPLPGKTNYFTGNDQKAWRTDVPNYKKVMYENVYPDIDIVYYGNQRHLEYDFVVKPGADPDGIKIHFEGADKLKIADNGDLIVHIDGGQVIQHAPIIYQEINGNKKNIPGSYVLNPDSNSKNPQLGLSDSQSKLVGFKVAAYDTGKPLIIDPVLSYSTYLGGSGFFDEGWDIAVDTSGNAYVTGQAWSTDFPTTPNALQPSFGGSSGGSNSYAFVTKLNSTGTAMVYSTYLGGTTSFDTGRGIDVDSLGNAYVVGNVTSIDFPMVNATIQPSSGGGTDIFVVRLNPTGNAIDYSTYLGGSSTESFGDIAVDISGNAYVTGVTYSTDFPTTVNTIQPSIGAGGFSDAFVTKLNSTGTAIVYSTFLGGSLNDNGNDLAVDTSGNVYVTGNTESINFPIANAIQTSNNGGFFGDAFVTKLDATGTAIVYSTYLGGSELDRGNDIAVDASGNTYVTGATWSTNFPTTANALQPSNAGGSNRDAFVTKLNPAGAMVYSTYLGGSGSENGGGIEGGITVDASENVYITGSTSSPDFPSVDALPEQPSNIWVDVFVTKLNPAGTAITFSTVLGAGTTGHDFGYGIAVDTSDNIYVTGRASSGFPTTANAVQPSFGGATFNAFVMKISFDITTNNPPVLNPIGNQTIDEGQLLQFIVTATDPDAGDSLTFAASNLPLGATFDPVTQEFSWTPTFAQAGIYTGISFTVIDDGTPPESASETIAITVNDVNSPPVAQCQGVTLETEPGICLASAFIDNGSSDPDGDPVNIVQDPAGPYPTGDTQVTLTITDNGGASDSCVALVTVIDMENPALTAAFVPYVDGNSGDDDSGDDDNCKGKFIVNFSASDNCDSNVTATAEINGIAINTGQLVELKVDNEIKTEFEDDGLLEIKVPSISLVVTATDAVGNVSIVTVNPFEGLICDDDSSEDDGSSEEEEEEEDDDDSSNDDDNSSDDDNDDDSSDDNDDESDDSSNDDDD